MFRPCLTDDEHEMVCLLEESGMVAGLPLKAIRAIALLAQIDLKDRAEMNRDEIWRIYWRMMRLLRWVEAEIDNSKVPITL